MGSVDVRETVLEVEGARLHVRVVGRGRPVIVLHGGPDFSHDYLLPELDDLAGEVELVYYDQRGRGRSSLAGSPDDVTIEREVADLEAVRRWLGAPTVAIVGHSWGAVLAAEHALAHPDAVSHLVLVNAGPVSAAGARELGAAMAAGRSPEVRAAMRALRASPGWATGDRATDDAYHRLHFARALADPAHLETVIARLRVHTPPDVIVRSRRIQDALLARTWQRDDYDLLPALGRLRVPAAVVHGDVDLVPVSVAERIAGALPDSTLTVLASCGHFAYLEHPAEFRSIVLGLLAR